jgi:hypothetical protein
VTNIRTRGEDHGDSVAAQDRYAEYLDAVTDRRFRHPHERSGQAHFNVLWFDQHDPDFADEIRGGELDPFNLDERVPAMLSALRERWGA